MVKRLKDIGELGLIKRLSARARYGKTVVKGIGDDAAVIRWTKDKYLLFTCDMSVEGVHFKLKEATPFQIGWKALGRNISDIAAMGGLPRYALVSIGLPRRLDLSFLDGVYKGVDDLARHFKIDIVGGDTAGSNEVVIDVSLIGEVEKRSLTLRSGARAGDVILVTGSVGGSIKGKHLTFMPRLTEARRLVRSYKVNSMIDVSDGLLLDLWRVLEASGAGATLCEGAIPVSGCADSFRGALSDGEDFELLFTMSVKEARVFFDKEVPRMKTPVALIGEVTDKKRGYRMIRRDGSVEKLEPKGYLHF